MAATQTIFDGVEAISGIQGGNPYLIDHTRCSNAINRFFRGDQNETRPPFFQIALTFEDGTVQDTFEKGNVQGAFFYSGYPSFLSSYILVACADSILKVQISGRTGHVTRLIDGNNANLMHVWFAQGYEWLFAQNGEENCVIWNGTDAAFRSNPANQEMPVGGPMEFIHGRMAVTSADGTNQIAVSDIVYGNNATVTSDIWKFTDITYWAEGGAFGIAAQLGDIMGIKAMPYLDTGSGQSELVVLCKYGATSFDLSGPRSTWLDTQVQRISLIGMGCESTHSLCRLNGDLIYKAQDGIRSYRNSRQEFAQGYNQNPISYDVHKWIRQENKALLQFNSQIAWNNLMISGAMPMMERNENPTWGYHRYHRGLLVLDCNPQSVLTNAGVAAWQGMWTGPRITAMVEGIEAGSHRAFCFSYDGDGVNRLYEFGLPNSGTDDIVFNRKKKIVSFFDTPFLFGQGTNRYVHKQLTGCDIELSNLKEEINLSIKWKPDNAPCFIDWKEATIGCECQESTDCGFITQDPGWTRRNFGDPKQNTCIPGSNHPADVFRSAIYRVKVTGSARVDRIGINMNPKSQTNKESCNPPENCNVSQCCPATEEFEYQFLDTNRTLTSSHVPAGTGDFLNNLVWAMACGAPVFDGCSCVGVSTSGAFGGNPEVTYRVKILIRGFVEFKDYTGEVTYPNLGTAPNFIKGGIPSAIAFNIYSLKITDTDAVETIYHLNMGPESFSRTLNQLNQIAEIDISGGSSISISADPVDGLQHSNDPAISLIDSNPSHPPLIVPQPFDGQWIQMNVLSVSRI